MFCVLFFKHSFYILLSLTKDLNILGAINADDPEGSQSFFAFVFCL